jgi:dienelactone hydrolase
LADAFKQQSAKRLLYLTTLPYVDRDRIGVLGICAGGGYAVNATMNDRRVKALGR